MAFVVADRVKETCTAPGTGTVTLLGASAGYQSFSVIGNGNTTYYCIADQGGNNWEVGIGTYTSSGTTLSRDTVLSSSNGGSKTNFSTGTQDVFVTYPSERSVYVNSAGAIITPDVSSVLLTTNGGTGLSTYTAGDLPYYATGTALSKLGIGSNKTILTSSGTAPQWSVSIDTTQGGTGQTSYTAGDLPYYAAGTSLTKLGIGSNKTILTSSGTAPQWSVSIDTTQGGTGQTSYTAGDLPYYAAGTSLTKLGIGANGTILTSTGSAPQWSATTGVAVTSISFGTTGLTPATATQGAVTVAGTLATTNGGTGLTSFTANQVFYASSTSAVGQSANLTFDGTTLTAANFADSSLTSGRVTYAGASGNLTDSANLTFDGTTLTAANFADSSLTAGRVTYAGASGNLTDSASFTFDGTSLTAPITNASNGILVNGTTVSANYTIASGSNGLSVGPMTVGSGVTVTVSSGQRWLVL